VTDARGSPVESAAVTYKPIETGPLVEGLDGETVTNAQGESTLPLATDCVFEIVVSARGFMTETARVRGGTTYQVHLRASASIRLRARDSDTGQLLAGSAELYRKERGRTTWVGSCVIEKGLHVFNGNIGPGTYGATVRKYGWRKASVQIEVFASKPVVEVDVLLHAEEGFECVSVAVQGIGEDQALLEGRTLHVFRQASAPSGEHARDWEAWSKRHDFESIVDGRVTLAIRSGDTCALLLVDGDHDLVAIVGNPILRDPGGERAVVLRPGHAFYFTPAKWGIHGAVADVAVVSKCFGPLPLASLEGEAGRFYPNARQARNQRLGPYPADAVVRVTPKVGEPVERTVQEAAK